MWLCKYFVYFTVYSVMGWIYESIYVTIRTGKWANRGFLYGPVVPIYGVGGVGLTALMDLIAAFTDFRYTWLQVFAVSFLGSIVLEYSTSWVLEKLFHARWWDYTRMPLNINGRVCFPYSCGFGVAGLLVCYVIEPATKDALEWVSPILYELFALICMGMVSADATLTVSALTDFNQDMEEMEKAFNDHMEAFVADVQEKKKATEAARAEHRGPFALPEREAVGNLLAENMEAFEARLAEERKRFAGMHLTASVSHMGWGRRKALSRVTRFSREQVDKIQLESALMELKKNREERKQARKAEKQARKAEKQAPKAVEKSGKSEQ